MKKASIAAVLLWVWAGHAQAIGGLADVTVYDRAEGGVLPLHYHEGRYYVVGKPGNEYQINVRNNQPGEILAVVSVDGVNAVSGETANWSQTGYVLTPNSSFGIMGWRKSLQRVAAFFFTELENSYAARTGRPDNVGVIGVAIFRKKPAPAVGIVQQAEPWRDAPAAPRERQQSGQAADAATMQRPSVVEKSLGTGHGQSQTSVVRATSFERATPTPEEVITIYYDSYRNLLAQGVIRDITRVARPNPFPGQFVPDPQ